MEPVDEAIVRALASMGDRDQAVLRLRLGLDDGETHSSDEVADLLGLDPLRVRQIEARFMARLRHPVSDPPRRTA